MLWYLIAQIQVIWHWKRKPAVKPDAKDSTQTEQNDNNKDLDDENEGISLHCHVFRLLLAVVLVVEEGVFVFGLVYRTWFHFDGLYWFWSPVGPLVVFGTFLAATAVFRVGDWVRNRNLVSDTLGNAPA